ncbi:MAG: CoA ester lyase [Bacteroidales bacterium]|jgi:citrate lyase subunit beta/citryl-CoA lyase|nr:CoA ester lyase [Bacteroidales bacterium]
MEQFSPPFLLRSLMFVPAHNERLLASAARSEADVLLLDLEDSVQTDEYKQIARKNIVERVQHNEFANYHIFPRVNDRESGQLLKDITQLAIPGIDGFMYPKAKTGEDIYFIDKLLETIEYERGYEIGTFKIIPIIETAAAVLNAQDICAASKRVIAVAYGCEDFISDLGGIHDKEGTSLFTARAMIAMAARAHNVAPIDTVHINVHDLEDLEQNIQLAKNLGFEGMLVLNPKEIPLVHRYYSPSEEQVKDAREMLQLFEESQSSGKGVALKDGKFIGPPMVIAAKKVLAKHDTIKSKNNFWD